jgi:branched-chain amino acid transport system substrate-binding protein
MLFRKAFGFIVLLMMGSASASHSAEALKVGFVAPLSGAFAPLGKQMQAGADVAAQLLNVDLIKQDELCTPESGVMIAKALVEQKVDIVVGFTCFESLSAALPILRDANIMTITTGVRANVLTDTKTKTDYLLYRLAPREDMEVAALAAALLPRWRTQNFAIVDDGTVQARNTAEALRFAMTEANLQPVFIDTFRPNLENQNALVRRLQKAGATHVFVGGDVEDALVISKAAKGELEIAIGESGNPEGATEGSGIILSIKIPEYRILPPATAASLSLQNNVVEPDNYALTAFAGIEVAAQAAKFGVSRPLSATIFTTAVGPVSFDEKGDLKTNPFSFVTLKNGNFVPQAPSSQ